MTATFETIDALRESLVSDLDPAYRAKQIHPVPDFPVVKRAEAITLLAKTETVLDVGGSGPLHQAIEKVAIKVYTWDKHVEGPGASIDLDDVALELPHYDDVTLIVCGETLEHLANPGWFLHRLKATYPTVPVVISVPNAHSASGRAWLVGKQTENVNRDHVAYYSYWTLRTLLERYGYTASSWSWYNGTPLIAEGLLVVAE